MRSPTNRQTVLQHFRQAIEISGHLGLWPGLYAMAAVCCFIQITNLGHAGQPWASGVAAVGMTTAGIYLMDRVKFRRGWIDPADCLAHPARYEFLCKHDRACRCLAFAMLAGAAICGARVTLWAPLVVVGGSFSGLVYAAGAKGQLLRLKDLPIVKNVYTALGLVSFVAMASYAMCQHAIFFRETSQLHAVEAGVGLLLARVLLDAALSDVGDEKTDLAFGTKTVTNHIGAAKARRWATGAQMIVAISLMLITSIPFAARAGWAVAWLGSSIALPMVSAERLSDFIDLRFAMEAIIASAAMRWF